MTELVSPRRLRRVLTLCLGLGISAATFGLLTFRARADHFADIRARFGLSEPMKNAAPALRTARPATKAVHVKPANAAPAQPVVMPSLRGKRLSNALREARELGLKLIARDRAGVPIEPELTRYYRIVSQGTAAGERVPPGAPVAVRVREATTVAAGY